jgi:hypothetical protein
MATPQLTAKVMRRVFEFRFAETLGYLEKFSRPATTQLLTQLTI